MPQLITSVFFCASAFSRIASSLSGISVQLSDGGKAALPVKLHNSHSQAWDNYRGFVSNSLPPFSPPGSPNGNLPLKDSLCSEQAWFCGERAEIWHHYLTQWHFARIVSVEMTGDRRSVTSCDRQFGIDRVILLNYVPQAVQVDGACSVFLAFSRPFQAWAQPF